MVFSLPAEILKVSNREGRSRSTRQPLLGSKVQVLGVGILHSIIDHKAADHEDGACKMWRLQQGYACLVRASAFRVALLDN